MTNTVRSTRTLYELNGMLSVKRKKFRKGSQFVVLSKHKGGGVVYPVKDPTIWIPYKNGDLETPQLVLEEVA